MSINWFPGHMVRARREIEENLKLVDIIVFLVDARAPLSCRNPELERLGAKKKSLMVLNKIDLIPPQTLKNYMFRLKQEGRSAAAINSLTGKGKKDVLHAIEKTYFPVAEAMRLKGRRVRPARVMVAGVPNVGKSSFINCLVGQKTAVTGAKPGVTRGKQWVRIREDIELLDTPGLMWPKVENEEQGLKLALLDIMGERAYAEEEVAIYLLRLLKAKTPAVISERLLINNPTGTEYEMLEQIARNRGFLSKGAQVDLEKTCRSLLQDFRKGKLGQIALDD
ncbi:ribosome biogenesis GTPase YlqF [Syntrophomonas palmitatica]|uniref:ribosome biogenesis GTPase YlqF n=1 Tax=Syntrophomonas palmitatica TaxID=402877 RepID=UPI0006D0BFB2|nr:ribosome biogenesis GTPase YlqF [Syntrophomonas palmitatica]